MNRSTRLAAKARQHAHSNPSLTTMHLTNEHARQWCEEHDQEMPKTNGNVLFVGVPDREMMLIAIDELGEEDYEALLVAIAERYGFNPHLPLTINSHYTSAIGHSRFISWVRETQTRANLN